MPKFLRRQFDRLTHFVVHKILGVHDSPHRIALGVAIGIFVAWTPTIGFQMAITIFLATLCRANKVVGVPLVWISNPATLWLYIPNYLLGCWLLQEEPSTDRLIRALGQAFGINDNSIKERFIVLVQTLWDVLAPLMLGSVIIGAALGVICYVATYRGVLAYHRWRQHAAPRPDEAMAPADEGGAPVAPVAEGAAPAALPAEESAGQATPMNEVPAPELAVEPARQDAAGETSRS